MKHVKTLNTQTLLKKVDAENARHLASLLVRHLVQ